MFEVDGHNCYCMRHCTHELPLGIKYISCVFRSRECALCSLSYSCPPARKNMKGAHEKSQS